MFFFDNEKKIIEKNCKKCGKVRIFERIFLSYSTSWPDNGWFFNQFGNWDFFYQLEFFRY